MGATATMGALEGWTTAGVICASGTTGEARAWIAGGAGATGTGVGAAGRTDDRGPKGMEDDGPVGGARGPVGTLTG